MPTDRRLQALHRVQSCAIDVAEALEKQRRAVAQARAAGASWDEVGQYLGVSGRVARRRFGAEPAPAPEGQLPLF